MGKKIFLFLLIYSLHLHSQELGSIHLPSPQKEIGMPLMKALELRQSTRSFDTTALPMQEISNLLWAADGINRPESGKRTAPSAMNWQEVDIYVFLAQGTFLYDAKSNTLQSIQGRDLRELTGKQGFVKDVPLNLVYTVDERRISRASDEEKNRWSAADVGFIAQNVYLYCASQGLAAVVRGMIDRDALIKALKLKPEQKIILAQSVGYPK